MTARTLRCGGLNAGGQESEWEVELRRFRTLMNSAFLRIISALLLLALSTGTASAASTLLSYHNRIVRATEQIERIQIDEDYNQDGVETIYSLLPETEEVQIDGQTIKLDNRWLHNLLKGYQSESDEARRKTLLGEAWGRLSSIDDHIRQLEDEEGEVVDPAQARAKAEEILGRPEYRKKGDDPITAFINDIKQRVRYFLVQLFQKIMSLFGIGGGSSWPAQILIGVILLLTGYGIVRLIAGTRRKKTVRKKKTVLGEEMDADLSPGDLRERAFAAARSGDFRLAVRNLYVSLLFEMEAKGVITIEPNSTNHEYLKRVSGIPGLAGPMGYLTERFDYFWYGMFPSSERDFQEFLAQFEQASQKVQPAAALPPR